MPIGNETNCHSCQSPHRAEIDRRLLANESTRSVSAWLEATHGVRITFSRLANHRREHLAIVEEARMQLARIEAAKHRTEGPLGPEFDAVLGPPTSAPAPPPPKTPAEEHYDAAVNGLAERIRRLDRIAIINLEVAEALREPVLAKDVTSAQAAVFAKAMRESREATVAAIELLEGQSVESTIGDGLGELLALAFPATGSSEKPS